MKSLKIALAQINPTVGDYKSNVAKVCELIDRAEKAKCQLVIFPEQSLCGYPVWDLANHKAFVEASLAALSRIVAFTRTKKIAVVVGYIDRASHKKSYNALAVIQQGKIIHKQFKSLLPNYDVFLEEIFFQSARERRVISLFGTQFGFTICEDIWDDDYSVKPVDELVKQGAQIIVNISASPFHEDVFKKRQKVILEKVKKHHVPVVYVNAVGGQDNLIFDGRSLVYDARGHLILVGKSFEESLEVVTLPSKKSHSLTVKENRIELIYSALVTGIRDYVKKNNFEKVVVGLSGGIDSALVATLAVDAIGQKNVIGVSMPGPYSSQGSLDDARELARRLGIEWRLRSIQNVYDKKLALYGMTEASPTPAMENLQARLRGLELMYISNDEQCLVLSTGNKSEMAMGYCTLYGDMCGGLSVLGDVYKTDIYRLAHYRNEMSPVIPVESITKPPSAELRPDQKDEDSLPPYSILDPILKAYIEENLSKAEIFKKISQSSHVKNLRELISQVIRKVDHNEYKRMQAAPCLRITQKAWFGRRMPITNRFESC